MGGQPGVDAGAAHRASGAKVVVKLRQANKRLRSGECGGLEVLLSHENQQQGSDRSAGEARRCLLPFAPGRSRTTPTVARSWSPIQSSKPAAGESYGTIVEQGNRSPSNLAARTAIRRKISVAC